MVSSWTALLKKILVSGALMLLGSVLTLGTIYFLLDSRRAPVSEDDIRRRYVVEYTEKEQATYGASCLDLKKYLNAFLEGKIHPLISARKPGENWDQMVTQEVKGQLDKTRQYIFLCRQLYVAGSNGKLNGLESVGFSAEIDGDYATMEIMLRHGGPSQNCDSRCLDERFRELRTFYERIVQRVANAG